MRVSLNTQRQYYFCISLQNYRAVSVVDFLVDLDSSLYSMARYRRKKRLIEGNAKCSHLKKLTCKGTLRQVFICLWPRTPYPFPIAHCICNVRKNNIILRSIERMLQTQLSMARKFPL
jgi:hypothetical protein